MCHQVPEGGIHGSHAPWQGRWEILPRHSPDITMQPQVPITGLGWQHRQKHWHSRASKVLFPTETCKQSRSYNILFPQNSSERNQRGCHSRGSFFLFHGNFDSTTSSPIIRHFRERKHWSPKGKNEPLAGRANSEFHRLASTSNTAYFLGLEQVLVWLTAPF